LVKICEQKLFIKRKTILVFRQYWHILKEIIKKIRFLRPKTLICGKKSILFQIFVKEFSAIFSIK